LNETVRALLASAHRHTASDAFAGMHRLKELNRIAEAEWTKAHICCPLRPPSLAGPVRLNARLGHYTQFVNFLSCPFRLAFARTACLLVSLSLRLPFTMTPLPCQRRLCMRPRTAAPGLPMKKPAFLKCQGHKRIPPLQLQAIRADF
jgi:hypothetical protein